MKKKKSFRDLLLYIYLTGAVLFIFLGPVKQTIGGRGPGSPQKRCYSNLRVIQGAVEMYNMDVSTMMTTLNQEVLREGKYIKSDKDLVCPMTEIGGTYSGEDLTDNGEIICSYHGGLMAVGPYDLDYMEGADKTKIKKLKKQIEYERRKYYQDCVNRIPYSFFWPLFSYPDGLTTYVK
jgi:hypothetical protein